VDSVGESTSVLQGESKTEESVDSHLNHCIKTKTITEIGIEGESDIIRNSDKVPSLLDPSVQMFDTTDIEKRDRMS
jgi:hypothetical protein